MNCPPSFYANLGIESLPAQRDYLQPFPLPHPELSGERSEKLLDKAQAAVARPWTQPLPAPGRGRSVLSWENGWMRIASLSSGFTPRLSANSSIPRSRTSSLMATRRRDQCQ